MRRRTSSIVLRGTVAAGESIPRSYCPLVIFFRLHMCGRGHPQILSNAMRQSALDNDIPLQNFVIALAIVDVSVGLQLPSS